MVDTMKIGTIVHVIFLLLPDLNMGPLNKKVKALSTVPVAMKLDFRLYSCIFFP